MFATMAASASLLIFALLWQKNGSSQIPDWVNIIGFVFAILGPLYREVTIFTIDRTDYHKLQQNWDYTFWEIVPRMIIVRFFLYLPITAWLILFIKASYPFIVIKATLIFAILISIGEWRIRKGDRKISEEKGLSSTDVEKLSERAMHTRFTWAVIFLAFLTGIVGLLSTALNFEASIKSPFGQVVYIVYTSLSIGLSYSFYALCHTSFLIAYLISKYENEATKSFLTHYWSRFYTLLFSTTRNNEVVFRKWRVIVEAIIVWVFSILLLVLKP